MNPSTQALSVEEGIGGSDLHVNIVASLISSFIQVNPVIIINRISTAVNSPTAFYPTALPMSKK